MESLPEKLRELTHKRYFAYLAVVVFAFITALVFALIAFQSGGGPSVEDLRQEAQDPNRVPGRDTLANSNRSPFERIIDAITGRKPVNPDGTTSQSGDPSQTTSNTDTASQSQAQKSSSSVKILSKGEEIMKKIEAEARPAPQVSVDKYVLNTTLPAKPAQVNIHQLKKDYSEAEVYAIAQNFGLSSLTSAQSVVDKGSEMYQMYDLDKNLYLGFNTKNGSYIFISDDGVRPATNSSDPRDIAEAFVQSTGMMQPCLRVTDAYEDSKDPSLTTVEMRCGWSNLGAPLLNTVGILNLSDNIALDSVQLGDTGFESSTAFEATQADGERGAADFNTLLITVDGQGGVRHVGSNILPIENSTSVTGGIISPQDALTALSAGQTRLTLTSPAGAGYIEMDKVYPNGFAEADQALVNDFVLAYSVIPGIDQDYLCPKWVSRSYGQLDSGYEGLFVSTLQAVDDPRCAGTDLSGTTASGRGASQVAGVQAGGTRSVLGVQAGGTKLAQNITPTGPAPTIVTGNAGTLKLDDIVFQFDETPALGCPEASTFTNGQVLDASKGIYMMWAAAQQRDWYIVFTQEEGLANLESTSNSLNTQARSEYLQKRLTYVNKCKPRTSTSVCPMPQGFATGAIISCVLLTTGSPSVYVHSAVARNVMISARPFGGIGYVDPAVGVAGELGSTDVGSVDESSSVTWNIFAQRSGILHFAGNRNMLRTRAYYEFRKNALLAQLDTEAAEPEAGYVLAKDEVADFVGVELGPQIGLSDIEIRDLNNELERELRAMDSSHVKLSLLPHGFVDTYLELEVKPQPLDMFRYIFYLAPAQEGEKAEKPDIQPIVKSGYYIVETGVLARN